MSVYEPPRARRPFFRKIFSFKRPLPTGPTPGPPQIASATPTANQAPSYNTTIQNDVIAILSNKPMPVTDGLPASSISDRPKNTIGHNPAPGERRIQSTSDQSTSLKSPACASAGFFASAHDFKIENSTFVEKPTFNEKPTFVENKIVYKINGKRFNDPQFIQQFLQNLDNGGTVLLLLNQKRVPGAEVDSSDRDPPPRCHPKTRTELLDTLNRWLLGEERHWDLIWLSGPAGAGKSAAAQTFAEHCQELGLLGASFFFSRLQDREVPKGIVATIAYQLASRNAGYNHLITRILSRDPSILDKTLSIQFRKLIVEPFTFLAAHQSAANTTCKPLVIVVDGVDECSDEAAQCQLITLIGDCVRQLANSPCPLLWLICSRPEWHLKRTFARADPPIDYERKEITCDAEQDIRDVYHILKDGLQKIHDETGWDLTRCQTRTRWPTESKLQLLSQKVGGLPILASVVLNFIGEGSPSPDTRLEICLVYLDAAGERDKMAPLEVLDAFYMQIMLRVPPSILPTTKQIIAFYVLSRSYESLSEGDSQSYFERVSEVGRFLGICEDAFYSALRNLHSVIDVPPSKLAHEKPLTFFHKSFADFLQDPTRSHSFSLDMHQACYDIAILALRRYNDLLQSICGLEHCSISTRTESSPDDSRWVGDVGDDERIYGFVESNVWDMCTRVEDSRRPEIVAELVKFNFTHLPFQWSISQDKSFSRFLQWLSEGRSLSSMDDHHEHDLIRFQPSAVVDKTLANQFTEPLTLRDSFFPDQTSIYRPPEFVSLHRPNKAASPFRNLQMAFWIGKGERTVLVLTFRF